MTILIYIENKSCIIFLVVLRDKLKKVSFTVTFFQATKTSMPISFQQIIKQFYSKSKPKHIYFLLLFLKKGHIQLSFSYGVFQIFYSVQINLHFQRYLKKTFKTGSNMARRMEGYRINQSPQIYVRGRASVPSQVKFITTLHDLLHLVWRGVSEVWIQILLLVTKLVQRQFTDMILTLNGYEENGQLLAKSLETF